MNAQFKKGVLELLVLLIINQDDEYGYSLIKKISNQMSISEGTVYPILKRLVQDQYVSTYQKPSGRNEIRKYYHITEAGKEKLIQLKSDWHEFAAIIDFL